jgi:hypothetical protein
MAHIKMIPPGSYSFEEEQSRIIKVSSRGLIGNDLSDFIKRAGYDVARLVRSLEFRPGEVPVHLIAIGSTEKYGPNRNGDGFREAVCRKYHSTFVKHARFYRDHVNKDPAKSYGVVKASLFNEPMSRIELIVALNETEEAAKRNRGLVADKELEKLASGKDIGVSMACRVPYDICSGCGNRARSREEYCDEAMCKYGGLKHNMGRLCHDGHILHADNTEPIFFDISHVYRPADRIAYVLGHVKAASGSPRGGAALAIEAGLSLPPYLYAASELDGPSTGRYLATLGELTDLEEAAGTPSVLSLTKFASFRPDQFAGFSPQLKTASQKGRYLLALTQRGIILPFPLFLSSFPSLSNITTEKIAALTRSAAPYLTRLFSLAAHDADIEAKIEKFSALLPKGQLWSSRSPELDSFVGQLSDLFSLLRSEIQKRAMFQAASGSLLAPSSVSLAPEVTTQNVSNLRRLQKWAGSLDGSSLPADTRQALTDYAAYQLVSVSNFPKFSADKSYYLSSLIEYNLFQANDLYR